MRGGREEPACGGTTRNLDQNAPKEIISDDMTLFNIKCRLPRLVLGEERRVSYPRLFEISCFAAKTEKGVFILYDRITEPWSRSDQKVPFETAFIVDDPFPELCGIVKKYKMAEDNGRHSFTHGLPEDFGGRIDIRYSSGEYISISNNQHPPIRREAGEEIAALFEKLPKKAVRAYLPDPGKTVGIRFEENRERGGSGYTRVDLTLDPNGGCTKRSESKYDGPNVYKSEKKTDLSLLDFAKETAKSGLMFAWKYLPDSGFTRLSDKKLIFTLEDGGEITVDDSRLLPDQLRSHFFNIELKMTT